MKISKQLTDRLVANNMKLLTWKWKKKRHTLNSNIVYYTVIVEIRGGAIAGGLVFNASTWDQLIKDPQMLAAIDFVEDV